MADDDSTKPKGGRPRKALGEVRTARLPAARVTEAERQHVAAQAARAGLPEAEFVRRAVLGMRIAERRHRAEDAALVALNRAAANLYQITRALNFGQALPHDLAATLAEVRAAAGRIAGDGE